MNNIALYVLIVLSTLLNLHIHAVNRFYVKQFPDGSEHLPLPRMILFMIFMGHVKLDKYPHLPLLLESMRWNSQVDFVLINIYSDPSQPNDILQLKEKYQVNNFRVVTQSMDEFSMRVKDRLGIDVQFNMSWFYKMCDYKPTVAHLFPEELRKDSYKYWGFVDMDVIWGNFSRFSHWFQGEPFVISGWWRLTGAAAFFINEEWTTKIIYVDKKYIPLLADIVYHNLDEEGTQTDPIGIVDGGAHALSNIVLGLTQGIPCQLNRGIDWKDHCFYDEGDSLDWAGPVRWHRGSLQVIHGSPEFPPGRELLFYHRPSLLIDFPSHMHDEAFDDMMKYGFLLPYWIPISSRYMSKLPGRSSQKTLKEHLIEYQPYRGLPYVQSD